MQITGLQHSKGDMMKEKLVVIVGPTAVGKTSLSLHVAHHLQAEIISGDSMQVYKGMDIGTAKLKPEQQQGIPHHLINIAEPPDEFSAAQFQQLSLPLITHINLAGRIPIIVGGTGLYVQSVTQHFHFADVPASVDLRQKWTQYLEEYGVQSLFEQLQRLDVQVAAHIHPNNTQRVIRALEIKELTGKSITDFQADWHKESPYDLVMIGLTMERGVLYERINVRVEQMMQQGLMQETQRLLQSGVSENALAMQAIGYKEMVKYLQGELSLAESVHLIKRNTRRFAKRQLTWFRRMPHIEWFDVTNLDEKDIIMEKITCHLAGKWNQVENI